MSGISQTTSYTDAEFARQCAEAGNRLCEVLFAYPKPVAICLLPATLAAVVKVLGMPRDSMVALLDRALADMAKADEKP